MAAVAQLLTAALPKLAPRDQEFAQSLLRSANGRWGMSDKQEAWAHKLIARADNPTADAVATVPVTGIVTLLRGAQAHLKYPKVRLMTEQGDKVVLGIAGERSKYCGDVMITDGGPFGQNTYYGRIEAATGNVIASGSMSDAVLALLTAFAADPAGVGALIGKRFGHCCFCARELETTESLAVGYGPVCADKYGLPWG